MDPLLEAVSKANHRLALFALYRLDDDADGRRHRFALKGAAHKLDAQTFFDVVRPELRFVNDPAKPGLNITIGDLTFRGFEVLTPGEVGEKVTKSMSLLKTSHLVEGVRPPETDPKKNKLDAHESAQVMGGELFRELVGHLDRMAGFDHPNFTRALTKIVFEYLPMKAEAGNGDKSLETVSGAALQRQLVNDVALRGQLLKYLTCLEDDEVSVGSEVTATLARIAKGGDDTPFHLDKQQWSRQIDHVRAVLDDLKEKLFTASTELREELRKYAGPWVDSIDKDPEYNFPLPGTGMAKDFFAVYREHKTSSDWVARFMRTEVLHSFVFCWLASKYEKHNAASYRLAGAQMFAKGVQNVAGRRYGESRRALREYMGIVDDQAVSATKGVADNVRPHLAVVSERLKLYFLPSNSYTRKILLERAARLFVTANQLAGGMTEEIHKKSTQFSNELYEVYQPLLEFCSDRRKDSKKNNDEEVSLNRDALIAFVVSRTPARETFVRKVFADAPETISAKDAKKKFVGRFTDEVMTDFKTRWGADLEAITNEEAKLKRLFGLWCGTGLEGQTDIVGQTHVVSIGTLPASTLVGINQTTAKERQAKTHTERMSNPKPVPDVPLPAAMAGVLAPRMKDDQSVVGDIVQGETKIGTVTAAGGKLQTQLDADKASKVTDLGNLSIRFGEGADQQFTVVDLKELPVGEMFPFSGPGGADTLKAVSEFDELVEKQRTCHTKFMGVDASDAAFRRMMRALKLAEVTLAAPAGRINLDAQDLSNSIGVILELVEKLGEPKGDLYGNAPSTDLKLDELLKGVNLSEFYPLADADAADMDKILAYHYQLCHSLKRVEKYLSDLREVRDFFDAVSGSDLEVEVVNRTLGDYANNFLGEGDDLFLKNAPLAVYATPESSPDGVALQSLDANLRGLIGDSSAKELQLPCVFLASGTAAPSPTGIPVIACPAVPMPPLDVVVTRPMQNPPWLLWVASLLAAKGCAFGTFDKGKKPLTLNAELKKRGLPDWDLDQDSVHAYLRKIWVTSRGVADPIVLLKWINYNLIVKKIPLNVGLQTALAALYGPEAEKADERAVYQVVFDGLPFGHEAVNVQVRDVGAGAFNPAGGHPSPLPGTEFQIDGREVRAAWAQRLGPPAAAPAAPPAEAP